MSRTWICLCLFILVSGETSSRVELNEFVERVASKFHDEWRRTFLVQNPNAKNRFKRTTSPLNYDPSDFVYPMILTVGSCLVHRNLKVARSRSNSSIFFVDILNMNYDELPDDWSSENRATSVVACRLVLRFARRNKTLDHKSIEDMSNKIHEQWMKRNSRTANKQLLLPYHSLNEFEKEKDRKSILIAWNVFNELKFYDRFETSRIRTG